MILICDINFYFQNEMDFKVRNVKKLCFIKHFLGESSYIWSEKFTMSGILSQNSSKYNQCNLEIEDP